MKESLEEVRLRELEAIWELGESRQERFRQLAAAAAEACERPIALVSLIDRSYQWIKAQVGLPKIRVARNSGVCEHTMLKVGIFEIADLRLNPKFRENPLVTSPPALRSYAGVPLLSARGMPLGALCVLDTKPDFLSDAHRARLLEIGQRVMAELEPARESTRRERLLPARCNLSEIIKLAAHRAYQLPALRPRFHIKRVVLNELYCDEYSAAQDLGKIFTRFSAEGAASLTVDSEASQEGLVVISVSSEGSSARKLYLRGMPRLEGAAAGVA